jgi:hypothetical protein
MLLAGQAQRNERETPDGGVRRGFQLRRYEFERYYCSANWCSTRKRDPEDSCTNCGNSGTTVNQRGKKFPWSKISKARLEERQHMRERLNDWEERYGG